jgi:hypothetical protein
MIIKMLEIGEEKYTRNVNNIFRLISSSKYYDDFGKMKVYGIEVRYGNCTESIEDISISKEVVISLLQKLETEKCSLLHFKDVVEDFVIDQIIFGCIYSTNHQYSPS